LFVASFLCVFPEAKQEAASLVVMLKPKLQSLLRMLGCNAAFAHHGRSSWIRPFLYPSSWSRDVQEILRASTIFVVPFDDVIQ